MMSEWSRVLREVTGPTPHSLAFRAKFPKPNVTGKQLLIWRDQELKRHEAAMQAKAHLIGRQINEREELNQRKWLHRLVQKRVDVEMQTYLAGEEERRERLRDLLEAEEKGYIAELESREETMEDRRINMRVRAKQLREQREEVRRKLVAEKKEQQFRESCEEWRTQWSKKHLMEVCEDRLAQLALKEELKKQKEREEATFEALWEEDRLAKEKKATEEAQKRSRRDDDMINMLNTQRAMVEAQKAEARRLKEEEAKLMEEERQLFKLEEERAEMERRRKLRECRDTLLDSMKQKNRRLDKAKQDELALDMKILDQALQESLEDTEGQKQRKKELLKEQQIYQAYLAQQMEQEKRLEKEMDKLRAEEMAKMWAKRATKEKAMKDARDRLLTEVLDTRRLQIEEKLQRNAHEQEALLRDRELLNAAIQEYNRLEEEKYARRLRQAKEYREELHAQVDHLKRARDFEKEEERREYALALEAERLYQQKMADVLSRPYMRLKDLHPLRRQLACSSQS
ncbi:cilia- and flagella-associated protein 53 [Elgaria multicarinata webbii]|uniref:cilia- and flagella-associated protein 53 n=1 Tax=Elgaria multicarinata webbii TaxID=159646 RepID=UPI002FCD6B52